MSIDSLLRDKPEIWIQSVSNELGRLTQGIADVHGNDAMEFILKSKVTSHKKVIYANMVCDVRPKKDDIHCTELIVGGDKLEYCRDALSSATSLLETKLLRNSVISDSKKGARFLTIDMKDQFLQSDLPDPEYMKIHSRYFSKDMRNKYNIDQLIAPDNYVYFKIKKGMYGLKQAVRLANDKLRDHLAPFEYYPDPHTPSIWKYNTRSIFFVSVSTILE